MKILRAAAFLIITAVASALGADPESEMIQRPPWSEIWGDLGLRGYFDGNRVAPNGVEFDPLFKIDFSLNIGLLPQKHLYVFLDADFWGQRAGPGITNNKTGDFDFSKRELDLAGGLSWNVVDRLELRGSFFTFNNLNRGNSQTLADTHQDGAMFEARYYFGNAKIYDTGRTSFVSLGFYPEENLIDGAGRQFRAALFTEAYFTYDVPILRSYLYLDAKAIAEDAVDPHLIRIDGGIAVRPFLSLPNLEFRIGDGFDDDLKHDIDHNLVYAAVRANFGPDAITDWPNKSVRTLYDFHDLPEIWGNFGISVDPAGKRIAPNGVEFTPLFMSDMNFNISLLPPKKLYLFFNSQFWVQRETANGVIPARDPAESKVSEREWDIEGGWALTFLRQFELRGTLYAQNNLNRGGTMISPPSPVSPSGFHDGGYGQIRYYFTNTNPYDPPRENFVEVGYYPAQTSINGEGTGIEPRAFARLYLSHDIASLRSYAYADSTFVADDDSLRLIVINGGLAARPFERCSYLEFRIGNEVTIDTKTTTRDVVYASIRVNFSTR